MPLSCVYYALWSSNRRKRFANRRGKGANNPFQSLFLFGEYFILISQISMNQILMLNRVIGRSF